jgi:hypothetical protein
MKQYIISKKAAEDLERIWQYTYFQWTEEQSGSAQSPDCAVLKARLQPCSIHRRRARL